MLNDLESFELHVVLVPQRRFTNEGGMIRVVANRNAPWYREFCATYTSTRLRQHKKHDTAIRRKDTLRALKKLIALATPNDTRESLEVRLDASSVYPYRLLAVAEKRRVNPPKRAVPEKLTRELWNHLKTIPQPPF